MLYNRETVALANIRTRKQNSIAELRNRDRVEDLATASDVQIHEFMQTMHVALMKIQEARKPNEVKRTRLDEIVLSKKSTPLRQAISNFYSMTTMLVVTMTFLTPLLLYMEYQKQPGDKAKQIFVQKLAKQGKALIPATLFQASNSP